MNRSVLASIEFTRRIFNSIAVLILLLIFNLLFNAIGLSVINKLELPDRVKSTILLAIALLSNVAGASNSIVLYAFRSVAKLYKC